MGVLGYNGTVQERMGVFGVGNCVARFCQEPIRLQRNPKFSTPTGNNFFLQIQLQLKLIQLQWFGVAIDSTAKEWSVDLQRSVANSVDLLPKLSTSISNKPDSHSTKSPTPGDNKALEQERLLRVQEKTKWKQISRVPRNGKSKSMKIKTILNALVIKTSLGHPESNELRPIETISMEASSN